MIKYCLKPLLCALTQGHSPGGGELMMNRYETIFIIDTEIGEENVQATVLKFKTLLENSAQLESIDEWGKRKLAYLIDDKSEGYYVFANFSAEPTFPLELERNYKITEGILKFIVINKEK